MGRQAILTHLKSLIETAVSGLGTAVTVYDYTPSDVAVVLPAVALFAQGTSLVQGAKPIVQHTVYVNTLVGYVGLNSTSEQDAQALLSDISDLLINMIFSNRKTTYWDDLNVELKSDVAPEKRLAAPMFVEQITLLIKVLNP